MASLRGRAGFGSNQYVTRPGGHRDAVDVAVVGAAFDRDGDLWATWATDSEIAEWWASGEPPAIAAWWAANGCSPEDAEAYWQCELTLRQVQEWREPTMLPWMRMPGVPADQVQEWRKVMPPDARFGLSGGVQAAQFFGAGCTPEEAAPWLRSGLCSPAEVAWWTTEIGGYPDENMVRQRWSASSRRALCPFLPTSHIDTGERGVLEYRQWGMVDPDETYRWFDRIHHDAACTFWHAEGIPLEWAADASFQWDRLNLGMVADPRLIAAMWRDGLDIGETFANVQKDKRHWERQIGTVDGWLHDRFEPEEARAWHERGFYPMTAREWSDAGFSAVDANAWQKAIAPLGVHLAPKSQSLGLPIVRLMRDRGGSLDETVRVLTAFNQL